MSSELVLVLHVNLDVVVGRYTRSKLLGETKDCHNHKLKKTFDSHSCAEMPCHDVVCLLQCSLTWNPQVVSSSKPSEEDLLRASTANILAKLLKQSAFDPLMLSRVRLTLYPPIFSHSTLCLVTGNCLLNPLKEPSANCTKALFSSSWNLFSAFAISLTTASAPLAPAPAASTFLLVLMRTLPSS